MSKANNEFEIGDKVAISILPCYPWMRSEEFMNKTFTIKAIVIKAREIQYEIENHPSHSYLVTSDMLVHLER